MAENLKGKRRSREEWRAVFDRFAAYGGTRYRAGDPYAGLLVDMVGNLRKVLSLSRHRSCPARKPGWPMVRSTAPCPARRR